MALKEKSRDRVGSQMRSSEGLIRRELLNAHEERWRKDHGNWAFKWLDLNFIFMQST